MAEADRLNLTSEERVDVLVSIMRGAQPASHSSPQGGRGKVHGGARAIDAAAVWRQLGRRGE